MITGNELKYYSSLLQKKYRQKEKKFIVEGDKLVTEGIESGLVPEVIFTTQSFYNAQHDYFNSLADFRVERIRAADFRRLTDTKNPQEVVAVFSFRKNKKGTEGIRSDIVVYLDNISDPGNTGTILRNCDWFGITDVLLSENSVELYNPKVVRSTMGSLFHLNIYLDAAAGHIEKLRAKGYKVICSDIQGEDLYSFDFPEKAVIVLSSEAHGPGNDIRELSDYTISIPKKGKAESLNVASASAVILALLTR